MKAKISLRASINNMMLICPWCQKKWFATGRHQMDCMGHVLDKRAAQRDASAQAAIRKAHANKGYTRRDQNEVHP